MNYIDIAHNIYIYNIDKILGKDYRVDKLNFSNTLSFKASDGIVSFYLYEENPIVMDCSNNKVIIHKTDYPRDYVHSWIYFFPSAKDIKVYSYGAYTVEISGDMTVYAYDDTTVKVESDTYHPIIYLYDEAIVSFKGNRSREAEVYDYR